MLQSQLLRLHPACVENMPADEHGKTDKAFVQDDIEEAAVSVRI